MSRFAVIRLLSGAYSLLLRAGILTSDREWVLPPDLPTTGQSLRAANVASNVITFEYYTPATGSGSGTVTSVALSAPTNEFNVTGSPISSSGTLGLAWKNQTANLVFASPVSGGAGAPAFRSLVAADIPSLDAALIATGTFSINRIPVGTAAGTVAAGNDARFHTQNTDTGTTAQSFQLETGNTGARIKNSSGSIHVRNAADSGFANFECNDFTVHGTLTAVESNVVNFGDAILTLNADYVGSTPTENGGIEIKRGTLTNASFIWDESNDIWKAGLLGSELPLARIFRRSFVAADVSSGTIAISHNLGNPYVTWKVYDGATPPNDITPDAEATSSNILTLKFGNVTIANTFNVVICG